MRLWFCLHCVIMTVCSPIKPNEPMEPAPDGKIVGGKPVSMRHYPSACLFFNEGAQCSGTIINSWTVVTAAHCFDENKDVDEMVIELESRYLYDFNAIAYDVERFVIHENYNKSRSFSCDIALIFVSKQIKFGSKAQKALIVNNNRWMTEKEHHFVATGWGWTEYVSICVTDPQYDTQRTYDKEIITVKGGLLNKGYLHPPITFTENSKYGGHVSEKGLLMAELRFVSAAKCSRMHNVQLTPDMFCLYGNGQKDTCKGDSGGGILWNNTLVGITSHGDGCARVNKPSVYSNVWYFRNWIKKQINIFVNLYCEENSQ